MIFYRESVLELYHVNKHWPRLILSKHLLKALKPNREREMGRSLSCVGEKRKREREKSAACYSVVGMSDGG